MNGILDLVCHQKIQLNKEIMASILEIRAMGSILERKGRGRIWNNDISSDSIDPKKKKIKKQKEHIHHNWDKDLWD